jgi:molecular chaperone GrpE
VKKQKETIDPEDQEKNEASVEEEPSTEETTPSEPNGGLPDSPLEEEAEETPEETIERLQFEAEEFLDGWQRARAEFANYKKRVERERENSRAQITGEIITRYLGVMDDLERALAKSPENEGCQEWVTGVQLIYTKLKAILEAEGVEPIEEEGLRFDPNIHEAISYEDSDKHDEGSVIEVTQRGYKLDDRVLRPAMVRVAK